MADQSSAEVNPGDKRPSVLERYCLTDGVADELMTPDGLLRPVWLPFVDYLSRQSREDLARSFARGDQYLRDAGVYYREYTGSGSTERDWPLSHVPVLIAEDEWRTLSDGIVQRAELLERVVADLYGPGKLVSDGMLPAELIAKNREWLRPMVGVTPRSGHFLHILAFEVGRSPDGSWLVLGDRTQAPSGSGFALENRIATSKVFADFFPAANVERLAGFFRTLQHTMNALRGSSEERVAILTPGPHVDTYFEHAYIARYLGFMLLECEDLKVRDDKLTVQTVRGPEPLTVVWRRLDSRSADPLELDETSAIGTPGFVAASRAGNVAVLNALGSGVLEARALLAFLPRVAKALLGEPLKLPNIATWWCGQAAERAYVADHHARMMIGPALTPRMPFEVDSFTMLGEPDPAGERSEPMRALLEREGPNVVAQEAVTLSTTPAMVDGHLRPRPMLVRVFAVRTRNGWNVMNGGYARIGRTGDPTALAMQSGGSVADVWVVGNAPVRTDTLAQRQTGPYLRRKATMLPSRAADNLFWLGRYVERAESRVRELRAYHLRLAEAVGRDSQLAAALARFVERFGDGSTEPVPSGLIDLFAAARTCASKVRDRFSVDGWHALNDLSQTAQHMAGRTLPGDEAASAMGVLLRKLAGFSGLVHENMFRFVGWRFLTLGRAVERADQLATQLSVFCDPDGPAGSLDVAVELGDSQMTHRRRYSVETNRDTVIDLLVLDGDNPRSLIFQAEEMRRQEGELPKAREAGRMSEPGKRILVLRTALAVATPDEISAERLIDMRSDVHGISAALTELYFY